jgi:hypothetical protein
VKDSESPNPLEGYDKTGWLVSKQDFSILPCSYEAEADKSWTNTSFGDYPTDGQVVKFSEIDIKLARKQQTWGFCLRKLKLSLATESG